MQLGTKIIITLELDRMHEEQYTRQVLVSKIPVLAKHPVFLRLVVMVAPMMQQVHPLVHLMLNPFGGFFMEIESFWV